MKKILFLMALFAGLFSLNVFAIETVSVQKSFAVADNFSSDEIKLSHNEQDGNIFNITNAPSKNIDNIMLSMSSKIRGTLLLSREGGDADKISIVICNARYEVGWQEYTDS